MLSSQELERIEPFDINGLVDYNPAFLTGFQSEIIMEPNESHEELADDKAVVHSDDIVRKSQKPFDINYAHVLSEIEELFSPEIVLLPVWFAKGSYKFDAFSIIINGQTKKTFARNPKKSNTSIIAGIICAIIFVLIIGALSVLTGHTLGQGFALAFLIMIPYLILRASAPTYNRNLRVPIETTNFEIIKNDTYSYKEFKKLFPDESENSSLTKLKNGFYQEVESVYNLQKKY